MSADKSLSEQFALDLHFDPPKGDQQSAPFGPRETSSGFTAVRSEYFKPAEPPYQYTYDGSRLSKLRDGV